MRVSHTFRTMTVRLAVAATIGAAAVAVMPAPAQADGCRGPICGGVRNWTGFTMHTTLDLWWGNDRCHLWNQYGGPIASSAIVACSQRSLGSWSTRGGYGSGVDVDAFTFNYRGYYVYALGAYRWRDQGVWTRLRGQVATCTSAFGAAPRCVIVPGL